MHVHSYDSSIFKRSVYGILCGLLKKRHCQPGGVLTMVVVGSPRRELISPFLAYAISVPARAGASFTPAVVLELVREHEGG